MYLDRDVRFWGQSGRPVALSDIHVPIFAVGTVNDHVSPAGIVSERGRDGRSFQVMTKRHDDRFIDPETFLSIASRKEGSWWPEWVAWLMARSGAPVTPPSIGTADSGYPPICDSPGTYVLQN